MSEQIIYSEDELRERPSCIACGKHKGIGPVVCWTCFKESPMPGVQALKYCGVETEEWQEQLHAARGRMEIVTKPTVRVAVAIRPSPCGGLTSRIEITDGKTGEALPVWLNSMLSAETDRQYRNISDANDGAALVINILETLGAVVLDAEESFLEERSGT